MHKTAPDFIQRPGAPGWPAGLLATTLLLCAAPLAIADTGLDGNPAYIGLNGGPSDFSRISNGNGLYGRDSYDTAYSLAAGNYFLSPNMGMELGYIYFGRIARCGGTSKADGIQITLIGKWPLGSSFNLLGKLGTTYGRTQTSAQINSGVASGSENAFDWSYGVGAEWMFNPQWSALLQYDEHYLKFAGIGSDRVTTTTLGVRMHF